MRILIAGAAGMLGRDLCTAFAGEEVVSVSRAELDITDAAAVFALVHKERPSLIINAAAFTNVDECETSIDDAYRVNAVGPRNLAAAAQETDAAIMHFSTDYVFAGDASQPQREYDPVGPVSIYGKSKLAGERLVQALCPRHYVIRTSWLYGLHGKNFVSTMLRLGGQTGMVRVVDDQLGSPTYTIDLAQAATQLAGKPYYGTYHLSNGGVCSWHQFARDIFAAAGMDVTVEAISSEMLSRKAKRPAYSVLDNQMWHLSGFTPLRSYKEALQDYMKDYKSQSGGTV